jgi:hypothetical protein
MALQESGKPERSSARMAALVVVGLVVIAVAALYLINTPSGAAFTRSMLSLMPVGD